MVKDYFISVRIINLLLFSTLFWGVMLQNYSNEFFFCLDHILLFASIISTASAGYLINNYYDIKSDEINGKLIFNKSSNYFIKGYFLQLVLSFFSYLFQIYLVAGFYLIFLFMYCYCYTL